MMAAQLSQTGFGACKIYEVVGGVRAGLVSAWAGLYIFQGNRPGGDVYIFYADLASGQAGKPSENLRN